jgi:hypothetical protein
LHVECDEVSVELVGAVLKELVVHGLEPLHNLVEGVDDRLDLLKLVLSQGGELLHGAEQLLELENPPAEEVEASEDLLGREVELLTLGHVHESLLGEVILLLVSRIEINAALHDRNELIWWILFNSPEDMIIKRRTLLWWLTFASVLEVKDGLLARPDHGRGDLAEEASHPIVGTVVTGNGVDHLDGVHQSGKDFLDGLRGSIVERLNEFVQSLEILDIVLGFIELLSDSEVKTKPLGGSEGNAVLRSCTTRLS